MKKTIISVLVLFLLGVTLHAQDVEDKYVVGFYNLENLFDTYDDPEKNDEEFLPDGANKWTERKYGKKLHNIARVISAMAERNGAFHTILGVSEIENRRVLEDLVSQPELVPAGYNIVHYDSPDMRGVDVAMLYRPENFEYISSESIPFTLEGYEDFKTRDILMVYGKIAGEEFAVYVAHLPSRVGGKGGNLRSRGAEIIREHSLAMMDEHPGIKVIVMGDMNDDPFDESMCEVLGGKLDPDDVEEAEDMFNPFWRMLNDGFGSNAYQNVWSVFDQILVNGSLLNAPDGTLRLCKSGPNGYYGVIFRKPFMVTKTGQYKNNPYRTFSYGAFMNGYSDHFPTFIIIGK